MATADGHPRSIAYSSRVPLPTINAINSHPFYANLIAVEHGVPPKCPYLAKVPATTKSSCLEEPGVYPYEPVKLSPAQLALATQDAARMHIGWAVVWKRNNSVTDFILPYLRETGFYFAYRTCGRDSVLVYKRAPVKPVTQKCPAITGISRKTAASAQN
jgi:hypothetical protein